MPMHKALHPREDVDRLYMSRRKGGRGLVSIESSVDMSIQRLEDYIEKRGVRLIADIRYNTNDTKTRGTTIAIKQTWEDKQLFGCFMRLTINISHEKTRTRLRKGKFKRETESLLIAAKTTP